MAFLVVFSIGPVQEFIAASRRTADLKAGSQLLVETARRVAEFLESKNAELIFPASSEIDPPNKLLCVVENNPEELVQEAHRVAQDYLCKEWQKVSQSVASLINEKLAKQQIDQFLGFYAAWVPLDGDYARAWQEVERLLAGRKALRDFKQPPCSLELPKSPLDPTRDTVVKLQDGSRVCEEAQRHFQLRLKPRETLDAVSLLKRIKGREMGAHVPSTSEMALRSIWSLAQQKAPQAVSEMEQVAQQFRISEVCDLFFPGRWDDLDTDQELDKPTRQHLSKLRETILKTVGVPEERVAYYAVLLADGDRMGHCIGQLRTKKEHQEFSQQVAHFAQQVPNIVKRHEGYLVYCGGDDVLALLPANRALAYAQDLHQTFCQHIPQTTLSAGIVLVHHLDNLQSVLEWARQAEREAKKIRNALAVALHPRSGEALTAVINWQDFPIWSEWISAFRQGLARGFPYELYALARDYEQVNIPSEVLRAEAERILQRKEGSERVQANIPDWAIQSVSKLKEFAQLLIIARFLADYPEVS